jgi:antitoxin Phd
MAVMKNNKSWATINPAAMQSGADRNAVGVAIDFMDEYADVFEKLAERLESQVAE